MTGYLATRNYWAFNVARFKLVEALPELHAAHGAFNLKELLPLIDEQIQFHILQIILDKRYIIMLVVRKQSSGCNYYANQTCTSLELYLKLCKAIM